MAVATTRITFTCCRACNADKGSERDFKSVDQVRRFLELYWEEMSRPWYDTFVVEQKDGQLKNPVSCWNATALRQKVRKRFKDANDVQIP
jgi:hypothetical protein